MKEIGIDQSQMPVSALKKETILKASDVLKKLDSAINEIAVLRSTRNFATQITDAEFQKNY